MCQGDLGPGHVLDPFEDDCLDTLLAYDRLREEHGEDAEVTRHALRARRFALRAARFASAVAELIRAVDDPNRADFGAEITTLRRVLESESAAAKAGTDL